MEELDVLLSDEFVVFTDQIKSIAEGKKRLKAEFEETYRKFHQEMKELDEAARKAQREFEEWKKERALNVGDG